jgi:hypothetical protein
MKQRYKYPLLATAEASYRTPKKTLSVEFLLLDFYFEAR